MGLWFYGGEDGRCGKILLGCRLAFEGRFEVCVDGLYVVEEIKWDSYVTRNVVAGRRN